MTIVVLVILTMMMVPMMLVIIMPLVTVVCVIGIYVLLIGGVDMCVVVFMRMRCAKAVWQNVEEHIAKHPTSSKAEKQRLRCCSVRVGLRWWDER